MSSNGRTCVAVSQEVRATCASCVRVNVRAHSYTCMNIIRYVHMHAYGTANTLSAQLPLPLSSFPSLSCSLTRLILTSGGRPSSTHNMPLIFVKCTPRT